jgi:hypothetical protein
MRKNMRISWKRELLPFAAAFIITMAGLSINQAMAQVLADTPAPFVWLWLLQMGTLCGIMMFEALVVCYNGIIRGEGKIIVYLLLVSVIGLVLSLYVPFQFRNAPPISGSLILYLLGALLGTATLACCIISTYSTGSQEPAAPLALLPGNGGLK